VNKMANFLKELLEQRAALVEQGKAILAKAESEKRKLSDEESTNYDKIFADIEEKRATIEKFQKQAKLEKELEGVLITPNSRKEDKSEDAELRKAFSAYFVRGERGIERGRRRGNAMGLEVDCIAAAEARDKDADGDGLSRSGRGGEEFVLGTGREDLRPVFDGSGPEAAGRRF
jgi:hypothetical protein